MLLGTGCLGDRALDGAAVREALGLTGLETVLLVVRPEAAEGPGAQQLEGLPVDAIRTGWEQVPLALKAAQAVRCTRLVLDLPLLMGLDAACRALFELGRSTAGLQLAVLTPAEGPLSDPETLGLLLDDLRSSGLGWWHRPARAHLDGRGDASWLDGLGHSLEGFCLDDVIEGQAGFPPGLGEIDFDVLGPTVGHSVLVALDVEPVADVALLRLTVESLGRSGLR